MELWQFHSGEGISVKKGGLALKRATTRDRPYIYVPIERAITCPNGMVAALLFVAAFF
jgi:hypothetical protein